MTFIFFRGVEITNQLINWCANKCTCGVYGLIQKGVPKDQWLSCHPLEVDTLVIFSSNPIQLLVISCYIIFFSIKPIQIILGNSTFTEGSLEVKLPTIWTDEKQRWKGSERRERPEERRVEEKESEERRCRCAKR